MWVYNSNFLLYWHFRIYYIQITHIEFIHSKWLPSRPYSWNPRWGFLHHWQSANGPLDFRAFWTDQNGNFVLQKTYSKHLQTESPKVACLIFFWEKIDENRVFEHLILVDIEFNCLQGPPPCDMQNLRVGHFSTKRQYSVNLQKSEGLSGLSLLT